MEERVVNPGFGSVDAAADRITLLPSRGLEDCSNDEAACANSSLRRCCSHIARLLSSPVI